jgi:hypothetical protein
MISFIVKHEDVRLVVRLLPSNIDTDRMFAKAQGLKRENYKRCIPAYFQSNYTNRNGQIILAMTNVSAGLVAHEVTHASLHQYRARSGPISAPVALNARQEEEHCRRVQAFTDKIWARVQKELQ